MTLDRLAFACHHAHLDTLVCGHLEWTNVPNAKLKTVRPALAGTFVLNVKKSCTCTEGSVMTAVQRGLQPRMAPWSVITLLTVNWVSGVPGVHVPSERSYVVSKEALKQGPDKCSKSLCQKTWRAPQSARAEVAQSRESLAPMDEEKEMEEKTNKNPERKAKGTKKAVVGTARRRARPAVRRRKDNKERHFLKRPPAPVNNSLNFQHRHFNADAYKSALRPEALLRWEINTASCYSNCNWKEVTLSFWGLKYCNPIQCISENGMKWVLNSPVDTIFQRILLGTSMKTVTEYYRAGLLQNQRRWLF